MNDRSNVLISGRRVAAVLVALAAALPAGSTFAQTALVQDLLTTSGGCTGACGAGRSVGGAQDFTGAGWIPHGPDDMIVYDLGDIAVAGSVEFTVAGFAPYTQYQCGAGDQYVEFVGISESDTCDHWAVPEAYIMMLYAPGKDGDCVPIAGAPNHASAMRGALNMGCEWQQCNPDVYSDPEAAIDHRFKIEWDVTGARLYSTENPAEEPALVETITFDPYPNGCSCECEQPLITHVCLGRTSSSVGYFDGPVFSNVEIIRAADYVPQDCCGAGGDGGGAGAGGTGGASGGGTGGTGATGAGGTSHGGTGQPAGPGDSEESGGCGCRAVSLGKRAAPGLGGAWVTLGLLALRARRRRPAS